MDPAVQTSFVDAERLFTARDYPTAARLLEGLLDQDPDYHGARSLLGLCRFKMQDYEAAQAAFRQVLNANSGDSRAAYNLGLALLELGRSSEATDAFRTALRLRPDFAEAERRLAQLRRGGEPRPRSLAEVLDDRETVAVDDDYLAGGVVWEGRPVPVYPVLSLVVAAVLLWLPSPLQAMAAALPSGPLRTGLAGLWHLAAAISAPAAALVVAGAVLAWLNCWITIRSHRLELAAGVLVRRHVVLWFHDLEQQVIVRQTFLEAAMGLGSLEILSTALPRRRRRRRSPQGKVTIGSRPIAQVRTLAADIRAAVLWERRRMIQNFISSR